MTTLLHPLFSIPFLRSALAERYQAFRGSQEEKELIERLTFWKDRLLQTETQSEQAFIDLFFKQTWGYSSNGERTADQGFTCFPKLRVGGAGQTGGSGEADLALGWFGRVDIPATPQVMCEFKDIRSNLDAKQNRKGNNRSPVKQCADYLREAAKELYGHEAIQPTWGIVSDMNEFRLYWRSRMPAECQRFILNKPTTDEGISLLDQSEDGSFQRFLFATLFRADFLLTTGGDSPLLRLLKNQWVREKEIENDFYREYRAFRERLYRTMVLHNQNFSGTKGRLVRLAQKLIDRCIFVLFCEDMGETLSFPPNALRDYLADVSRARFYDPMGHDVWDKLKDLFRAMDKGDHAFGRRINRFNGGMFAHDVELDSLFLPNSVFCERMQGENEDSIKAHPQTLLYLSAGYNFGTSGAGDRAITLYTLGRIFEQSITELEVLEAEAEDRLSLTKETKRKRDGVYYTPEWVVRTIVEETLGARLADIRAELGWSANIEGDEKAIKAQLALPPSKRSAAFTRHVQAVQAYKDRLNEFTVLDPACGSGAFLIHVLEYLLGERRRVGIELARTTHQGEGLFEFNSEKEIREILSRNIYGVDINPSSIEITRLALWLHTAKPDQALCDLDGNVRDGNSLIGPEFYETNVLFREWNADKREQVNAFDWAAAFPRVFDPARPDGSGFDCIVGNPPYVKLQNFRKVYKEMAEWLKNAEDPNGQPIYRSTQKGNFDLFLPFIEKSIGLLNTRGRLGFIAPSLWRYNEYGEGLRGFLRRGRHLDRWIDFGSFQVFEEAITYTALQFYSKAQTDAVRFVLAPDGRIADTPEWDDPDWRMDWRNLSGTDPWVFVPRHEREFIARLQRTCRRLDDPQVTAGIFVGVQTSADHIYHLRRVGENLYRHEPKEGDPFEVRIEDALMRPLVSGEEAKRYAAPRTETYILFPYRVSEDGAVSLISREEMERSFSHGWAYLRRYEAELRNREGGKMDNDGWYGWNYPKNIDKQDKVKLIAPRLILKLFVSVDAAGEFCLDNVDAGGIMPTRPDDLYFLAGVLNSAVANFVWRRTSKPFQNDYRSANKQFISPLPVPRATAAQKAEIGGMAENLQRLHTARRDKIVALERRLGTCPVVEKTEDWLFPALGTLDHWKAQAPATLSSREKTAWAKAQHAERLDTLLEGIAGRLQPGCAMDAAYADGELHFLIDGVAVIDRIFLSEGDGNQALLWWSHLARTLNITEKFTVRKLTDALRRIPMTDNAALSGQIAALDGDIRALADQITTAERTVDDALFTLYALTDDEKQMVLKG